MINKKNIVILGSTGSIGESALDIVRQFPKHFSVLGLSANANIEKLAIQAKEFNVGFVAIADETKAVEFKSKFGKTIKVFVGRDGVCELACIKSADVVLVSIVGSEAIFPLLSAIKAKKTIALANKEAIVIAGSLVISEAKKHGVSIVPIDSEQSAIFQCMQGEDVKAVDKVYLTASGGSLWNVPLKKMHSVTMDQVLAHPRWKMGKKITVDSATLMNKGLEVLEAQQLFSLKLDQIKVLVHREAIVHSMVEFRDGSMLAQLAATDMRLPIQYALSFPNRLENKRYRLNPLLMGGLTFAAPDENKFPCLRLAYEAGHQAGIAPCVLNAANEVAVDAFLKGKLKFLSIPKVIEKVLEKADRKTKTVTLDEIFSADIEARIKAKELVNS